MLKIKSWIGEKVRIKKEYIYFDEDGHENITAKNGIRTMVDNATDAIFVVKMDMYGVDLFNHRHSGLVVGSVEPEHQIIIETAQGSNEIQYPFLFEAKYFEKVC